MPRRGGAGGGGWGGVLEGCKATRRIMAKKLPEPSSLLGAGAGSRFRRGLCCDGGDRRRIGSLVFSPTPTTTRSLGVRNAAGQTNAAAAKRRPPLHTRAPRPGDRPNSGEGQATSAEAAANRQPKQPAAAHSARGAAPAIVVETTASSSSPVAREQAPPPLPALEPAPDPESAPVQDQHQH